MRLSNPKARRLFLFVGVTAVVIGYFAVWLPGPAAGLRLIGLELGEWIKFLGVGQGRNWFYGPPILLGLIMALLSTGWKNGRWQTWVFRLLAVAVSLLAFPAIAAITTEPRSEWLARVIGIAAVLMTVLLAAMIPASRAAGRAVWWAVAGLSVLGIVLPLWQYLIVRPIVSEILQQSVGIGLGVWLNCMGFLAILIVACWMLWWGKENRPPVPASSQVN